MSRSFDPTTFPSRWREADAREALVAWRSSGLSVCAFARRHGLHSKRLYRWFRRLGAPPSARAGRAATPPASPSFVEVVVPQPETQAREQRDPFVVQVSDAVVQVPPCFDRTALADLLGVLRC